MSGHSKWSNIQRRKGAQDAKRGKVFTKVSKEITTAARIGGGDPSGNARLRKALDLAKANNMPADNVDRAIKKGTGELEGVIYEELVYEGYGPEGVAVVCECMTENKNRTVADVRHLFSKFNGNLGQDGCVAWMFDRVGLIVVEKSKTTEDHLMEVALEAGADDIKDDGDTFEVITQLDAFDTVLEAIENAKIEIQSSEITRIPQTNVKLEGKAAQTMLKLYYNLDDHDDVQNVYANFDIDDETMENFTL
ncbi:MAG: YebC/PmpR family DNA-binding transcriptional regulator [Deltaproteobacteria bacterium]|nr:YebC/PmpR family DNA-binding transcriptional regulator [Deltaproteobacteria bacterium]